MVTAPAVPAPNVAQAQSAWTRVLQDHVNNAGEVEFAALGARPDDLNTFVRFIADAPLSSFAEGSPRLAHMINAYNALSMFNVVQSGIPPTHAGFNKVTFFVLRKVQVGGQDMSLRSFENDIIRPYALSQREPRIHFALNCSAVSCPVLPRTPFTAAALGDELEREARAFFARPLNFRADATANALWLSEILSFYPEDFVPVYAPNLINFANRYAAQAVPENFQVKFTPYDWTIANARRPSDKKAP